jgi:hypothetical protein
MTAKNVTDVTNQVLDLIYGRWRSQILYAGAELGIFDHLARDHSKQAEAVAAELHVDAPLLYRLMRALTSLGLLIENDARDFATSELGELFRSDHPQSLRYRVLCTEGPEQYAIWKHLPNIISDAGYGVCWTAGPLSIFAKSGRLLKSTPANVFLGTRGGAMMTLIPNRFATGSVSVTGSRDAVANSATLCE